MSLKELEEINTESLNEDLIQEVIFNNQKQWNLEQALYKYLRRKHPRIRKVKRKVLITNKLPF